MKTTGRGKKAAKKEKSPAGRESAAADRTARRPKVHTPRVAVFLHRDYAFARQARAGIAHYAAAHGPWEFFLPGIRGFEPLPKLDQWDGDGIIAPTNDEDFGGVALASGVVMVDISAGTHFPTVTMDNAAVGRLAAEHLIAQGHQHFGYVGARGVYSRQRQAAFAREIRRAGLREAVHEPAPCERMPWKWQPVQRLLVPWLQSLPKPTGVTACSDYLGRQVTEAARNCGVLVPDEVAVVSVGNDVTCEFCNPPLSSISIAGERVGYEAARLLDRLMKGGSAPKSPILIPPDGLVVRRSSDMLALADADVAAAVRFIRTHGNKSIGVADVLAEVPISRSSLERRFRDIIGHTPWREIRLAQIAHVKKLLAETDIRISRVAAASAFSDAKRLCNIFRAEMGMTPGAYRRQFRTV